MVRFIEFLVLLSRIFIGCKFAYLLFMINYYPDGYKVESLYWFICYFIGDMWFMRLNREYYTEGKEDDEDEEN